MKKITAKVKSKKPAVTKKPVKAAVTTVAPKPVKAKKAAPSKVVRREIATTITTEIIAARAYTLWEKDGRPHGRDVQYWLQAEQQLKKDTQSFAE